jgi:hypothetical protein
MSRWVAAGTVGATLAATSLIAVVVVGTGRTPAAGHGGSQSPTMAESGAAMGRAADAMLRHADAMRVEGQRSGSTDLLAHARHWADDGAQLLQRAAWMGQDPASRAALAVEPAALVPQGNLAALVRGAGTMLHSPEQLARARAVDLDAVRWGGESMRGEGRLMAERAATMMEDVDQMVLHHGLAGAEAAELREAVQTVAAAGRHAEQSGAGMVEFAARAERGLGKR